MSLPLVVSASKLHILPMKSMRRNYKPKVYLNEPHYIISTSNPQTSKAHLYNHRSSKTVKTKSKNKLRTSNHMKNSSVQLTDCEAALNLHCVAKGKHKIQAGRNSPKTASKRDVSNKFAVGHCTAGRIISSCSSKSFPSKPFSMRSNTAYPPRRPTTGSPKVIRSGKTSEFDVKGQNSRPLNQSQSPTRKDVKIRKVYYSEAQSQTLAGVPCAPPATPLNDFLIAVDIIPCMADIKSQQTIKAKLRHLENERRKANEKITEKLLKEQKRRENKQKESMKQQQRAEIYALNKVMTDLERDKFQQFMKERNNGTTTISLKV